ncbi:MAG: ATP cone domain-containing protein [Phycisphaerales bacterium]|nr:ATP cone domain-containing protein [Phycisphaerales bacterium]
MDGSIRVMKRDGSIEPFVIAKLVDCVQNGFRASGEPPDRSSTTPKELAGAVEAYLEKTHPNAAVPSEHLAELVELVLTQTGYTAAGMAIKQHTQLRTQQRRWLRVAHRRRRDGRFIQRQWNKSRIDQYLRTEHRLDPPASRMIASRVEQLVFNCGLKVVTTGLVEEMTNSELLAWGLLPGALVVKKSKGRRDPRRVVDQTDQT